MQSRWRVLKGFNERVLEGVKLPDSVSESRLWNACPLRAGIAHEVVGRASDFLIQANVAAA